MLSLVHIGRILVHVHVKVCVLLMIKMMTRQSVGISLIYFLWVWSLLGIILEGRVWKNVQMHNNIIVLKLPSYVSILAGIHEGEGDIMASVGCYIRNIVIQESLGIKFNREWRVFKSIQGFEQF